MVIIITILLALIAAPLLLGLNLYKKSGRGRTAAQDFGGEELPRAFEKNIHVEIYSFDAEVKSIDDVKAIRMSAYRDTGEFIGYSAEGPVFKRKLRPDRNAFEEIARILDCAKEAARVSDGEMLYFFTSIKPLALKSPPAQSVYHCVSGRLKASQSILCRMKTILAEEDTDEFDGGETADYNDDGV